MTTSSQAPASDFSPELPLMEVEYIAFDEVTQLLDAVFGPESPCNEFPAVG